MSQKKEANPNSPQNADEEYLEFVKERARHQNYHAEEKLKDIDDLAEMISIARRDYRKKRETSILSGLTLIPLFRMSIRDRPGRLDPFEPCLNEAVAVSASKIMKILGPLTVPIPPVDVVAYVNPAFTTQGLGFGGYSPSANLILISVNPEFPELERSLKEELPGILAHELHHCMRWAGPGYGATLFEALITEGLACDFEREIRGGIRPRYLPELSPETMTRLLSLAAPELDSKSYHHSEWFFGSKERGIPSCAGYALGLFLIEQYKTTTGKRTEEIVLLTAAELKRI
jgi:hypothetical protein